MGGVTRVKAGGDGVPRALQACRGGGGSAHHPPRTDRPNAPQGLRGTCHEGRGGRGTRRRRGNTSTPERRASGETSTKNKIADDLEKKLWIFSIFKLKRAQQK